MQYLLVAMVVVCAAGWVLLKVSDHRTMLREQSNPRWQVVPAVEDQVAIGYLVRWSEPDAQGRYLWVRHYYAGEDASIGWCENAAERDAERMNNEKRVPWEFVR